MYTYNFIIELLNFALFLLYLLQSEVESQHELRKRQARERERMYNRGVRNNGNTERFEGSDDREGSSGNIAYGGENSRRDNRWSLQGLTHLIPQVHCLYSAWLTCMLCVWRWELYHTRIIAVCAVNQRRTHT